MMGGKAVLAKHVITGYTVLRLSMWLCKSRYAYGIAESLWWSGCG